MIHGIMTLAHAHGAITNRERRGMDGSTICTPDAFARLPQHAKLASLGIHLNMLYPRRRSTL